MHEVSLRKCGLITHSLCHVATDIIELSIYKGLQELCRFLEEFEEKVSNPHRLLALGEALEATPAHWWEVRKDTIHERE